MIRLFHKKLLYFLNILRLTCLLYLKRLPIIIKMNSKLLNMAYKALHYMANASLHGPVPFASTLSHWPRRHSVFSCLRAFAHWFSFPETFFPLLFTWLTCTRL